jgi:hypothetical protein
MDVNPLLPLPTIIGLAGPGVLGIEDDNAVEPVLVPREAKHCPYHLCNASLLSKLNPAPPNTTSVGDIAQALLKTDEEEEDMLIVENTIIKAADTAVAFTKLNPFFESMAWYRIIRI